MFDYLIGKVSYKNNNYLIFESNFKGYKIYISDFPISEENGLTKIFVYTKIFQNNKNNLVFEYYGFKTLREKIFFENLLTINGIGPKTSLLIMHNDLDVIKELIKNEDIDSLSVLEGFNNKIALAIVSGLSYKIKNEKNIDLFYKKSPGENDLTKNNSTYNAIPDLVSALKALGYKKGLIEKAVNVLMPQIIKTKENQISDLISQAIKVILNETASGKTTIS